MKPLQALGDVPTYLSRYVAIRDAKQAPVRAVLVAQHAQISSRYEELLDRAAAGDLQRVGASPLQAASRELRSCYGVATQALLNLKRAISKAQPPRRLKYCPYCCMTKGGTHDHYLPASLFPEFAVNGFNLVPCCSKCNSKKGDDWLDGAGRRRYFHFYLDAVPDADFLKVDLLTTPPLVGVGARFSLDGAGIEPEAWRLVREHFERLDLLARYDDEAADEIAEFLEDGATHLLAGGTDVRAFMRLQAASSRSVFGRANWRAVLLAALADHPELEDWIAVLV